MVARIRRQHQDDTTETKGDCGPAIGVDFFFQEDRSKNHGNERGRKRDGGEVSDRNPGQRGEGGKRADDAEDTAQQVVRRALGPQGTLELSTPAEHDQDRDQREHRAEERHLAFRIRSAQIAHLRTHDGEHQRTGDLE